jgi:Sec-independent protein translocase protein TatA
MNIMGIGLSELAVILLVAFLVLGPNRSISMARTAGQVLSHLRRTFTEVAAAASQEETEKTAPRWDSVAQDLKEKPPPKTGDE